MKIKEGAARESLKKATLEEFGRMTEAQLQSTIVEPLLRLMHFTDVRDVSGYNDKGKDLVALKEEPFAGRKLYAIQIKKFTFTGKHNKPSGLSNVITQLRQAFQEEVIDPELKTKRCPDRCLFITPFPLNVTALESAFRQFVDFEKKEITVIDGVRLADSVLNLMPEALANLSAEMQYRVNLARTSNIIQESTAFAGSTTLKVSKIFVDLDCDTPKSESVLLGALEWPMVDAFFHVVKSESELSALEKHVMKLLKANVPCDYPAPDSPQLLSFFDRQGVAAAKSKVKLRGSTSAATDQMRHKVAELDFSQVVASLRSQCTACAKAWRGLCKANPSFDEWEEFSKNAARVSRLLLLFRENPICDFFWKAFWQNAPRRGPAATLPASRLLRLKRSALITGGPGAGKTTLLRWLAQVMANTETEPIPIFIYLNRLKAATESAVLAACVNSLHDQGLKIKHSDFRTRLRNGDFRVLLDGLDETGLRFESMHKAIVSLSRKNPRACIILTCRDTYGVEAWDGAFHFEVKRFSDVQMDKFIGQWFLTQPSYRNAVSEWLTTHGELDEVVRTPINATLLCSLVQANKDLPTNEAELHEERLALLLGRWEKAKGITPLARVHRESYTRFLSDIAIILHKEKLRSLPRERLLEYAKAYRHPNYHNGPAGIIDDCIMRGVLFSDGCGGVSLGHLAYQEFLVAKWLIHHQPTKMMVSHLTDPWWHNALRFYAVLRGDLSPVVESAKTLKQHNAIEELLALAPHTYSARRIRSEMDEAPED